MTTTTKPETKKSAREREREEAKDRLREMFPPGSTVYTVLRHVSRSGMMRRISVVYSHDGDTFDVDWLVARALGERVHADGGIIVGGCGMDMGFHLAYRLSYALYPNGFTCTGRDDDARHRCSSNDHTNGDRNYEPHHHKEGGYALAHRWI